jgi:hypothetical protein
MSTFQSQPDGALYELVARGKKDTYFIAEDPTKGIHPFNHSYNKIEPHLAERRRIPSRNAPQFGQTTEFELERYGDMLKEATLLIDLPTWIPEEHRAACQLFDVTDSEGVTYGWTRGIAYFMIDTLELFQDKIQIYQVNGDALYFSEKTSGTATQSDLQQILTGDHDGTLHQIAANAAPTQLRISIPWPGLQGTTPFGFPLLSTTAHSYRVRLKLKKASELIESSAASALPFGKTFHYIDLEGNPISFQALSELNMKVPTIMMETVQLYMRDELRSEIIRADKPWSIPFRRWFVNRFPINENNYSPLDKGGSVVVTRRLEGVHPTNRIWFAVRADTDLCAGKHWKIMGDPTGTNPTGRYWGSTKLLIAGRDRELEWDPLVTENLNGLRTEQVMPAGMGAFIFSVEDLATKLGGTINMSQADRASLQIQLLDAGTRKSEILVVSEAWGIYSIKDGRGVVEYIN